MSKTKMQLTGMISEQTGVEKDQIIKIFDAMTQIAYQEAKNGGFVFPGIGKLTLVKRKARIGRNPATGAAVDIPAKASVKFKVDKTAVLEIMGGQES